MKKNVKKFRQLQKVFLERERAVLSIRTKVLSKMFLSLATRTC